MNKPKPKQIRANLYFLSAQYKKNKQGRAIAGTPEVLDAAIDAIRDLEKQNARLQQIIATQRWYTRRLHQMHKYCKDKLVQAGLYNKQEMLDDFRRKGIDVMGYAPGDQHDPDWFEEESKP